MDYDYDTVCEKCSTKLHILETEVGYVGGKEKEKAVCKKCGNIVAEHMVNGFLEAVPT